MEQKSRQINAILRSIPQGIAHAVDRVMFPLPVGDLVQTLQADRERRFTTFLKMLYISGLQDTLAGKIIEKFFKFKLVENSFYDLGRFYQQVILGNRVGTVVGIPISV